MLSTLRAMPRSMLITLSILDPDGSISMTSLMLFLSMSLLVLMPGKEAVAAFLIAVLNLNIKKWFRHLQRARYSEEEERIKGMKAEIDRLCREFEKVNAIMNIKGLGR